MALSGKQKTLQKSPRKSRGIAWKDKDEGELIELMKEETIMFSLENAKTPKEKRGNGFMITITNIETLSDH